MYIKYEPFVSFIANQCQQTPILAVCIVHAVCGSELTGYVRLWVCHC